MSMDPLSRRDFLKVGAAAGAAVTVVPALAQESQPAAEAGKAQPPLATRKLGKTGVAVSMLNQGTVDPVTERHLNIMHDEGVRYIDTARSYADAKNETIIGEWFAKTGHRKEYFLVTKDSPRTPDQWVEKLDQRLETLKTDYIDLFFIHGLGDDRRGIANVEEAPRSKEWAAAADKMRKSGKVRFVGFSAHCDIKLRTTLIRNAADGGWVDAVMPATDLKLMRDNKEFNDALDKCHKAGVGLIAMKTCKGDMQGVKLVDAFVKKGLNAYTAILAAVWTDERFASICSHMNNVTKLKENVAAARSFKPLTPEELAMVHEMLDGVRRTYCVACDGSCRRAAGTNADLNTIARYVSYLEEGGRLKEVRAMFRALPPEARDWSGADLLAASHACRCKLDFATILNTARERLA